MKDLILLIAGAVIGRYVTVYLDLYHKKLQIKKGRRYHEDLSNRLSKDLNTAILESGKPFFRPQDINISDSGKNLIVAIPEQYRARLLDNDPTFVFRTQSSYNDSESFLDLANLTGIRELPELIVKHADLVALDFISRQESNRLVFNGEMFGVKKIRRGRKTENEINHLQMQVYKTDFFTYQVFASIHRKLKSEGHPIAKVSKLEELQNSEVDYSPFLSSFGLNAFVLLNDGTSVVLGERSEYITHNERKYHFSMNEAFSQTDLDYQGRPSLYQCLHRGLQEELNINNDLTFGSSVRFLDLFFSIDKFEIGMTAVVNFENLTFEHLTERYKYAPDASLETHCLKLLDLDNVAVNSFLRAHNMTDSAEYHLRLLSNRKQYGSLD